MAGCTIGDETCAAIKGAVWQSRFLLTTHWYTVVATQVSFASLGVALTRRGYSPPSEIPRRKDGGSDRAGRKCHRARPGCGHGGRHAWLPKGAQECRPRAAEDGARGGTAQLY